MHNEARRSHHFLLECLSEGVLAAFHQPGGAAISNAGIVDLGDRTLVYDSCFTPQAARDLRTAAEVIGGRPVDLLINSHHHNDHVWGNQAFGQETIIVSTEETRHLMLGNGPEELNSFEEHAVAELASLLAQAETDMDTAERYNLSFWIDYYRAYVEAEPRIRPRLPDITFVEHLTIRGSQRSAELMPFVGAHSESDSVLWLADDRIVFMSDLLFVGCHPFLGEANPEELMAALEAVADLSPETLVPGHGPAGTMKDLELMMRYVRDVDQLARDLVGQSPGPDALQTVKVPEPYASWDLDRYFYINLHALSERQNSGAGGSD